MVGRQFVDHVAGDGEIAALDLFRDEAGEVERADFVRMRLVDKARLRPLGSERLINLAALGVEVNEHHLLLFGDAAHRVRIVAKRVGELAGLVERQAVHRRDEYRRRAALAGGGNELLEQPRVVFKRPVVRPFLLHVVVTELDEQVVAFAERGEHLFQPSLAEERAERLARLGMIRNDDAVRLEKPRQHLTPTGPGLVRLVGHRRIAGKVECDDSLRRLDVDAADRRVRDR